MQKRMASWRALFSAGLVIFVCTFFLFVESSSAQDNTNDAGSIQQGAGQLFMPLINGNGEVPPPDNLPPDNLIETANGTCPAGYHLIHRDGASGFVDPD